MTQSERKVLKTVKLTTEQARALRIDFNHSKIIDKLLGKIIVQLTDEICERESQAWEDVRKIGEVGPENELQINWSTQEVIIFEEDQP
jgi:hypothetical protein